VASVNPSFQIKGWKVYVGKPAHAPKTPGQLKWTALSSLYTVKEAAEVFAEIAKRSESHIEIRAEYCLEKKDNRK
jgi:hypothetical protein